MRRRLNYVRAVDIDLPQRPFVLELARMAKCSIGDAFLAVFKYLAMIETYGRDGVFVSDRDHIDFVTGIPGFADNLEANGLICFNEDGTACCVGLTRGMVRSLRRGFVRDGLGLDDKPADEPAADRRQAKTGSKAKPSRKARQAKGSIK